MEPNTKTTKVFIADDHTLFADGLEQIVDNTPGFKVVAKVNNGKILMQAFNKIIPDLILLDINMPFLDGLQTALEIKRKYHDVKIIFISMHYDSRYKVFIKENDIDGFLIKNVGANELREALKKAVLGIKVFTPPAAIQQPAFKLPETGFMKMYQLTKTEIGIIQLIAEGESSKMIADKMNIQISTVETHRKNIFRKLNAKNMADVVAFAVTQGIYKKAVNL